MIWPISNFSAGIIGFIVWLLTLGAIGVIVFMSDDDEVSDDDLILIGGGLLLIPFILNLYKIYKMFSCSCKCNNCA